MQTQLPTSIILQNGDTYTFQYVPNHLGELSSITLPTGGVISYGWSAGGWSNGHGPSVQSRTVTANGQSSTWQFGQSFSGPTQPYGYYNYKLKVTDPLLNDTVSTCSPNPINSNSAGFPGGTTCWVTNEIMYNGSAADNHPIATRAIGYQAVGPTTVLPSSNIFTWNATGATTETDTTYDNNPSPGNSYWHFTRGNLLSKAEYDYGTASHGPLLSFTKYAYLHDQTSAYAAANIADRVAQVSVYNSLTASASALVAQTSTSYDGFDQSSINGQSGIVATSGMGQHDYVNYSSAATLRGLPTETTKYTGPSSSISTYVDYNDLGEKTVTIDRRTFSTSYA